MAELTRVLVWGRAEYERQVPFAMPPGAAVIEAEGADAPIEACDVLVVPSRQRITAAHAARTSARWVLTTTSGVDHVDVRACLARGIRVARLPLARRDAVVQTTLAMILSLTRRLGAMAPAVAAGVWDRAGLPGYGPTELGTVGVIGHGVIGSEVARVLGALGADVRVCDPRLAGGQSLDGLVRDCDVLTLHCALNPETERMFDAQRIAALRPGTVLVNTARGRLVDPHAALAALQSGQLAGLGLDVLPVEPPTDLASFVHPRCIVTPHAAGWHPNLDARIADGVFAAVSAFSRGEPVPFEVGD